MVQTLQAQQKHPYSSIIVAIHTGGHVAVRVFHRWLPAPDCRDDLTLSVVGTQLEAPLIERLLELPLDIHRGTLNGEVHVRAHDPASWDFPEIYGKIACTGR